MRIIVHRGSHQIGGSCIEVSSGATRIILDAGLPLEGESAESRARLRVPGLFDHSSKPMNAIFLSHAHADHSGLISSARPDVPVYLTAGTSKMMLAGGIFARQPTLGSRENRLLRHGQPVSVGPLTITAWPVDHSVYDSSAFIIEAEGKRVLYTGDLRFHGRKPGMARQLARNAAARPIDLLLIEGTRLGPRASETNLTEKQLEAQIVTDILHAPGIVLAMYSPLNLDRFVTFYKAAVKSGRTLVVDPYQTFTLHLINRSTLPKPGTRNLRTLLPPTFGATRAGKRLAGNPVMELIKRGAIDHSEILSNPKKYILLFRPSMQSWLSPAALSSRTTAIFSYWPGYLREDRMKQFQAEVERSGGTLLSRHSSGHGHPDDLRRFVGQVQPRSLVPIHTSQPEEWKRLWSNTQLWHDAVPYEPI